MRGFLRRDWFLSRSNLWLWGVSLGGLLLLACCLPPRGGVDYLALFPMVLGINVLRNLFDFDGVGGWSAYAAAIPGGREGLVDARYLFALGASAVLTGLILLLSVLRHGDLLLWSAGFYGSALLLVLAMTMPVYYRFGMDRGRLASIILAFVLLGVLGGVFTGILNSAREDLARGALQGDVADFFTAAALALPGLGLAALALSWRISRHIMGKKEF